MWSLAGNQAVDQPIPHQLCSWDVQAGAPASLALEACTRSRGIHLLWVCEALKLLCALSAQLADQADWAWDARAQAADSAAFGLGRSPAALCLENAHPAGPALGEHAAGRASGPVLGGPIQPPWA